MGSNSNIFEITFKNLCELASLDESLITELISEFNKKGVNFKVKNIKKYFPDFSRKKFDAMISALALCAHAFHHYPKDFNKDFLSFNNRVYA